MAISMKQGDKVQSEVIPVGKFYGAQVGRRLKEAKALSEGSSGGSATEMACVHVSFSDPSDLRSRTGSGD